MEKQCNAKKKLKMFRVFFIVLSILRCFENVLHTTINYDFQIFHIYIMSNKKQFEFLPRDFNFYNTHQLKKKHTKKTCREKKYISHKLFRCLKIMQEVVNISFILFWLYFKFHERNVLDTKMNANSIQRKNQLVSIKRFDKVFHFLGATFT